MSQIPELMGGRSLSHPLPLAVGKSSSKMYVGGQANADVAAGTALTATATEANLTQYAIPADSLVAGSTIRAQYAVVASAVAGGTDNLIVDLTLGASATGSGNESTVVNAAFDVNTAGDCALGDVVIQIRTAGASGTAVAWGSLSNPDTSGVLAGVSYFKASFAVNTTVLNYLTVTGKWSNGDANTCASQAFIVDIVNPGV